MLKPFHSSPTFSLGVEIELQLIDPTTRRLLPHAKKILRRCEKKGVERVKAETHQSVVEIDSEISKDVGECRAFLKNRIEQLSEISKEMGIQLCVSGTHPFQKWVESRIYPKERYLYLRQKYQWLFRRMSVYGLHVHVGVTNGDRALHISHGATRYLPHLLALSASSPFWQGIDTGMGSCRIGIMDSFPYAGLPHNFATWKDFEYYYNTLHKAGAITCLKDLYWFLRPNPEYGTLEFRICDALPTLSETMAIVAFTQCLVAWLDQGLENATLNVSKLMSPERSWIAPENQWAAARDGLDAIVIVNESGTKRTIKEDILLLVERFSPLAKTLNCYNELQYIKHMVNQGTSAQRQREVYNKTGSMEAIVDSLMEEWKLDLNS